MIKNPPTISVIIVTYNAGLVLENTLKAIINQDYKNFELVIIDGDSQDNTVDIIKKYHSFVNKWVSEPDDGLYDAMNKGINLAQGKYVWFINAGDRPYRNNTFALIAEYIKDNVDIVYGNTMMIDNEGNEIGLRRLKPGPNLNWKSLKNGLVVCHQAIIVRKEIVGTYNLKYKIAADYDWILNALKKSKNTCYTNSVLISFLDGGLSKRNIRKALKERFEIMVKNFGFIPVLFNHIKIALRIAFFYVKNKRF